MEKVRVLRIIEYVGDRKWVENTLKDSIHGIKTFHSNDHPEWKNVIKAATIDQFPEILNKREEIIEQYKSVHPDYDENK